jgi:hypothetical protein
VGRLRAFFGNFFAFLFARSSKDQLIATYIVREHERGRRLSEIVADPYIRNRATEREVARVLDRPEVVHALGRAAVTEAQDQLD